MAASRLTARSVEQVKPGSARREIPDAGSGLYLIVQPSGARSWAVRYRHNGIPRKHTLGPYPRLDLTAAREAARAALEAVDRGNDPALLKREASRKQKAGVADLDLFSRAWDEYLARHVRKHLRHSSAREVEGIGKREFLPRWKRRRLSEITKADIVDMLDEIADRGHDTAASRVHSVARRFFNWCVERDLIAASPCASVKRPAPGKSRDRVLTNDEIRWVWKSAKQDGQPFGPMIQLLLLTGTRRDEVRCMSDNEISTAEKVWSLPPARTKNGRAHDVHLSAASLAVLEGVKRMKNPGRFVFCTNGTNAVSGFSRAKARIDKLMLATAKAEAKDHGGDPAKIKIAPWRIHDLRRTVASGMARLGIALPVIERCLNHVSGSFAGIVGVYQKHEYADEKQAAFDAWARHVEQVISGKPANVIPMQRGRASA
jgi:site-specific recombinase XerD